MIAATTPNKPKQTTGGINVQSPASTPEVSSEPTQGTKEPTEPALSTAIPITQETAPFTPKVHRPKVGTIEMLSAISPDKHTSFLAKQEFFAKKEQESREKQQSYQPHSRPQSMISPKSEFGVPVMLINHGKAEGTEEASSPRDSAVSPRSDVTTPRGDAVATPRSESTTPRTPTKPAEEPAKPSEEKEAVPTITIKEPEPEPQKPDEPKEPAEPKEPTEKPDESAAAQEQATPEPPKEELTPEQFKRAEKQKKKDLKKEKKRLSDMRKKEKRRSGAEGDFVSQERFESSSDLQKVSEEPEEKFEITVPVELAIHFQTLIRASMARIEYIRDSMSFPLITLLFLTFQQ